MERPRRIVLSLATAQVLFQTSSVLLVTIGGLAGQLLAPRRALATLPLAMLALGTALTIIPASLLMSRRGRRMGFLVGAVAGALGGAAATLAIVRGSFWLLCAGLMLLGSYQAFAQFYRFAAAESAAPEQRGRAISFVLAGGVVAAVAGPALGSATRALVPGAQYAGSFAAVVALALLAVLLLAVAPLPAAAAASASHEPARPLRAIARQPKFVAAITGAAAAYGVMVLVMTATPLSMHAHRHGVEQAASVIQWHVLGMFVPSFFTGALLRRFRTTSVMLAGVLLFAAQVAVVTSGIRFGDYVVGLVLLGVAWNFMFVGGSTLLMETYRPSERGAAQGLNDFLVVGVSVLSSFSAGALLEGLGWRGLNLVVLPVLAVAAAVIALAAAQQRRVEGRPVELEGAGA